MRRIWSLGALGEGSSWDLRVRPAAASGNLGIWGPGNPEIWEPKNQNPCRPDVRNVWISRGKLLLALVHAISDNFGYGPNNKTKKKNLLFSLVGEWALFSVGKYRVTKRSIMAASKLRSGTRKSSLYFSDVHYPLGSGGV